MIPVGSINNINLLLISMNCSYVLFLYTDDWYLDVWSSDNIYHQTRIYKEVEDFVQNRNL
jgi:hypothetical protein